jgi:hypothetical protein
MPSSRKELPVAYIHVYTGTVTAGGTNGTAVSEGTGAAPITTAVLSASSNEVGSWIKCAVRCDTGYKTSGTTTITPTGTTAAKWDLAPDNAGSAGTAVGYGNALSIATEIGATNTLFWTRAKATSDEAPVNDTSVDLVVAATIVSA